MSNPERIFTAEDLIELNREVLGYGGGRHGAFRYESGLLYALDRPWMAFASQDPLYPEPYDKAAALMEILIRNYPFVDDNKRTAYVAGITLLRYLTGERVDVPSDEALAVCQAVERKDGVRENSLPGFAITPTNPRF